MPGAKGRPILVFAVERAATTTDQNELPGSIDDLANSLRVDRLLVPAAPELADDAH